MVLALVWNDSKAFEAYVDHISTLPRSHSRDLEVSDGFLLSLPTHYVMPLVSETGGGKVTILRVSRSDLIRGCEVYQATQHGCSRN